MIYPIAENLQISDWDSITKDNGVVYVAFSKDFRHYDSDSVIVMVDENSPLLNVNKINNLNFTASTDLPHKGWEYEYKKRDDEGNVAGKGTFTIQAIYLNRPAPAPALAPAPKPRRSPAAQGV